MLLSEYTAPSYWNGIRRTVPARQIATIMIAYSVAIAGCADTSDGAPGRAQGLSAKQREAVVLAQDSSHTSREGLGDIRRCLFIILDASNARHFSYLGYDRETSPNVDALGDQGVRFMSAHGQTSNTLSSARTYLTGRYLPEPSAADPLHHGYALPENTYTLASAFSASGYQTAAFSENPYVSEAFNFTIGFDHFRYYRGRAPIQIADGREFDDATEGIVEEAKSWIRERKDDSWFCYIHLLRPHNHYGSPEPYLSRWNDRGYPLTRLLDKRGEPMAREVFLFISGSLRGEITKEDTQYLLNLYDGNIAYVDALLGDFIAWLKKEGIFDSTLVIIASDHGEAFMQHGHLGHNTTLYEDMTHVPMVFSSPQGTGFKSASIDAPVGMIDVFPTLVELFDLTPGGPLDGRSLVPLLRGESREHKPFLYAQTNDLLAFSIRSANHKVIFKRNLPTVPFEAMEIYDLSADEEEKHNLLQSPEMAGVRARAEEALVAYADTYWTGAEGSDVVLPQATLEELEALGYLGGDED